MKRIVAAGASLLFVLGGCGGGDDEVTGVGAGDTAAAAGAAGGTSLAGSPDADTPDADLTDPGPNAPSDAGPEVVKPRKGMDNVRPVNWESAKATGKRTVRVQFYGGVEPCDVLDSVKVTYTTKVVKIGLFSGSDPAKPDSMCIEIAKLKAVDVTLAEDLAGRKLVDANAVKSDGGNTDPETDGGTVAPEGKVRGDAPPTGTEPKAGQANLRTITFTDAKAIDKNTIRVNYMAGVAPCDVLDHVEVVYTKKAVTITLYLGSDPKQADAVCPAIAGFYFTDVNLDEPLAGREIVDGAA